MHKTSLTIKEPWMSKIKSGEKKEEYREYKTFYHQRFGRFVGTDEKIQVRLINGMKKDSPSIVIICKVRVGYGNTEWGAPDNEMVYILDIIEVLDKFLEEGNIE